MDTISQLWQAIRSLAGNERAIANAGRLLDQRRFEDRVVLALVARVDEVVREAA